MKFCSGGMLAVTRVKMSDSEKRVNKNTSDIPSIKRATRKFLEVSPNSSAKQRQRNVQKSVLHVQSKISSASFLASAKSSYYLTLTEILGPLNPQMFLVQCAEFCY